MEREMASKLSESQKRHSGRAVYSRVTRKGQVTIPALFRHRNRIKEGSSVEMIDSGSRLIIAPVPDLIDLVGCDKGRYSSLELKKTLDESRKSWR